MKPKPKSPGTASSYPQMSLEQARREVENVIATSRGLNGGARDGNIQITTPNTPGHRAPATQLGNVSFNPALLLDPRRGMAKTSTSFKKADSQQLGTQASTDTAPSQQPVFTFSGSHDVDGPDQHDVPHQGQFIERMHNLEERADHPSKRLKRSVSPDASQAGRGSHLSQSYRRGGGSVAQHIKDHRARITDEKGTTAVLIEHQEPGLIPSAIDLTGDDSPQTLMSSTDQGNDVQMSNNNADTIDLTTDVADGEQSYYEVNGKKIYYDPQDSEEKEVCYGRIEGTRIQAFLVPDPKKPISNRAEWPSIKVTLVPQFGNTAGRIKAMDPTGTWFGNVDMKTSYNMKSLLASPIYRLRLDARLDVRSKDQYEAPGQPTSKVLSVTVNLYGPRKYAIEPVGKQLSQRSVWLRQPKWVPCNMDVFNPQCADPQLTRQVKRATTVLANGMSTSVKARTAEQEQNEITSLFENLQKTEVLPLVEPDSNVLSELLPHQKQALGWMLKREDPRKYEDGKNTVGTMWRREVLPNGEKAYCNIVTGHQIRDPPYETRGGLLADMMGLGKTLELLALVSYTKRASRDFAADAPIVKSDDNVRLTNVKTTLLICPLSVIANWEDQIASHIRADCMSFYIFHGPGRTKDPGVLSQYDVVLTTYPTVKSELFPSHRPSQAANSSPLATMNFFRVVLDEAHFIRTAETQQAKAAMKLHGVRRWCLTATPVQNKLEDLGTLIRFLCVSPFDVPGVFNQYICAPFRIGDPEAVKRLRVLVDTVTLRRLKDKIDLPPRRDVKEVLSFSESEQSLYDFFAADASKRVQAITTGAEAIKRKLAGRGYINILRSILCLRQISAHGKDLLKDEDLKLIEGQDASNAIDVDEMEARPVLDPAQAYSMYDLLKETNQAVCANCLGPVTHATTARDAEEEDPVIGTMLPCYQLVCNGCVKGLQRSVKAKQEAGEGRMTCPFCQQEWRVHLFEITLGGLLHSDQLKEELKSAPRKAKAFARYDGPHTKTTALINKLMDSSNESLYLRKTDPNERPIKSVVFSAWTTHLDLIGIALHNVGIQFTSLIGSMTRKARKQSLTEFADSDDVNVILISIGTGGVGLNLTAASRVYLMDTGFNPMAEQQAIDRVHRLGQKREVVFTRFIMSGSIEEKILDLQRKKMDLADLSLQRGKMDKTEANRRRLEELKELFR